MIENHFTNLRINHIRQVFQENPYYGCSYYKLMTDTHPKNVLKKSRTAVVVPAGELTREVDWCEEHKGISFAVHFERSSFFLMRPEEELLESFECGCCFGDYNGSLVGSQQVAPAFKDSAE
jgi:hypothetical protein